MPILVVCPGCKTSFHVHEKFAGKQGPCPKCKAVIAIPTADAKDQIVIHVPDEVAPGNKKSSTASAARSLKPITRPVSGITPVRIAIIAAVVILIFAMSWILKKQLQESIPLRIVGLIIVSVPICLAGYWFTKNEDLEAHGGIQVWIRSALCALAYAGLWGGFHFLPEDFIGQAWNWIFVAPPFLLVGGLIAFGAFEIDYGSGFLHYVFYLLVILALAAIAGLAMPWAGVKAI